MNWNRVAKLERVVRTRPCPRCGRVDAPLILHGAEPAFDRLSRAEQAGLGLLIHSVMNPPCPRCGRASFDLGQQTDEQLNRALALLRTVFGREVQVPGLLDGPSE
ncbi:hypothetical protein J8F10_05795 [Gemmata sp. G18]|uniref:YgiT-type zinc finger protein n=1 Tax=Gemmata palustris TaxID=2822762 RepID=A0ABS5BPL3_9BACT|nr:hypothetical protein [Gemmata palustris]MBP3954793.1 hypothetical protein [Gemmata palustris]